MKKILLVLVICISLTSCLVSPASDKTKGSVFDKYIDNSYDYSISYPKDWKIHRESSSEDKIILYNKDGNKVTCNGGYMGVVHINEFYSQHIEEEKSKGKKVTEILTDNGEKGIVVEGEEDGKKLYEVIIIGEGIYGEDMMYCDFRALVTHEFWNKNENMLVNMAKTLKNEQKAVHGLDKRETAVDNYKNYLDTLSKREANSVNLALDKLKSYPEKNGNINDALFKEFRSFYYDLISEMDSAYRENKVGFTKELLKENDPKMQFDDSKHNGKGKEIAEILKENGLELGCSENGEFITKDPEFLVTNFQNILSNSMMDFIKLEKNGTIEAGKIYLVEPILGVSWDEIGDRIAGWEKYVARYPNSILINEANIEVKRYLRYYTLDRHLKNMPMFENDKLNQNVRKSYERYIEKYPDIPSSQIIKGYYEILKNNSFILTGEARDYLRENGVQAF